MLFRSLSLCIALSLSTIVLKSAVAALPNLPNIKPTPEMEAEAKNNPNGWVYAIDGKYGLNDALPPDAIAGAWKVDPKGIIVPGSFRENPKYKAKQN